MNQPQPIMQQPKTGNVTRIATSQDVRSNAEQMGLAIINVLNRIAAERREADKRIEAKLDRIIEIMQTAAAASTTSDKRTRT
jgi:predicted xylose isomerase-like sugar epimerase